MIYTNKFINSISLVISIIIILILNFCFFKTPKNSLNDILNQEINEEEISKESELENTEKEEDVDVGNWYIEIPAINLKAPIAEGTDSITLNTKVGHFTDTSLKDGNIGLAAHNRGYDYNYFENLKKLEMDDEIIYTYEDYSKIYIIDTIEIIENTDWSYLDETEENKITLITCVENEPLYRRCVQAAELET